MALSLVKTLDGIIDSDRYTAGEILGRGCWGKVHAAKDNLTGDDVAIKVLAPTDIAANQMILRQLTADDVMRKEGLRLAPCRYIVPRIIQQDRAGRLFIVMPKYDRFLSHVIDERAKNQQSGLPSGFSIEEVLAIASDIVSGVEEIHQTYKRAHCDIKPDNLALDARGRVLITDMGTSTYFSSASPDRDNMGCAYTRPLHLFMAGEHPTESADAFAVGSLLFKLFTGKYIFEEEIDQAARKPDGLRKFAEQFVHRSRYGVSYELAKYNDFIKKKIDSPPIPKEISDFVLGCLSLNYPSGSSIKWAFEHAVESYKIACVKDTAYKQVKREFKEKMLTALGGAAALGTFILGIGWMMYFGKPDFSNRADLETRITMRDARKSEIVFEAEKVYFPTKVNSGQDTYKHLLQYHLEKYQDKTVIDRFVTTWIKTMNETGFSDMGNDFINRSRMTGMYLGSPPATLDPTHFYNDYLKQYLQSVIQFRSVDEKSIPLEDVVIHVLVGPRVLYQAQKIAGSTKYSNYISAMHPSVEKQRDDRYVIAPRYRQFAEQFMRNLMTDASLHVRVKAN